MSSIAIEIDSCQTLSNGVYNLNQSLSPGSGVRCLILNASDISLDCQSNIIDGDIVGYGIFANGSSASGGFQNITISNCFITGMEVGIFLINTNYSEITSITVNATTTDGIYLDNSHHNNLSNLTVNFNSRSGLRVVDSTNNYIFNSVFRDNLEDGIFVSAFVTTNNVFDNITSTGHDGGSDKGVNIVADGVTFTNSIFDHNSIGFYISDFFSGIIVNSSYFRNNSNVGVELGDSFTQHIFYNNFFNNTENFDISGNNQWNTTSFSGTNIMGGNTIGGNAWFFPNRTGFSDTCSDVNSNGICDTNYTLATGDVDFFPLTFSSVDSIDPVTGLIIPLDSAFNDTSSPVNITFSCNATDNTLLDNLSLYITNSSNQSFSLNQTTNISGISNSSSWILPLVGGNYTWSCLSYDSSGNFDWGNNNRSFTVNFTSSNAIPTVSLISPSQSYVNDSATPLNITFSCNATDEVGLVNLSLYLTNSTNQSFSLNQSTLISGTTNSSNWSVSLIRGNYTWGCQAFDIANQTSLIINRTLTLNSTSVCGDGIIEGSEVCDGSNFNGATCSSNGFSSGSLTCTNSCTSISTSSCILSSGGRSGRGNGVSNTNSVEDNVDEEIIIEEELIELNETLNITLNISQNFSFSPLLFPIFVDLQQKSNYQFAEKLSLVFVDLNSTESLDYSFVPDLTNLFIGLRQGDTEYSFIPQLSIILQELEG